MTFTSYHTQQFLKFIITISCLCLGRWLLFTVAAFIRKASRSQSRAHWQERLVVLLYRLLSTVDWTTATLHWISGSPASAEHDCLYADWSTSNHAEFNCSFIAKVYLHKLQSVQNIWLLVQWLQHVDVIASLQFLSTYTRCVLVNEWSSRGPWRSESVSTALFQPIPQRSLHTCPGLWSWEFELCMQSNSTGSVRPDCGGGSEVSPSMDRPPGTVCHLHYEHQSYHRTPSYVHYHAPVLDCPAPLRCFMRFRRRIHLTDWLTYLLTPIVFWHSFTLSLQT